jgi:hypothetical protein
MTSHEREAEFPVHIEVGKSMDKALPKIMGEHNKKVKNKKYYPTLYISDIKGLEKLPKEGCILVDYVRKSMHIHEIDGEDPTCSVELEIHTVCLPEEQEDHNSAEDLVDDLAKKAGIAKGGKNTEAMEQEKEDEEHEEYEANAQNEEDEE